MYVKPGASQQDWQRDNNDCLVKANQAGYPGGDFAANINRKKFIKMCLQGQGWTPQTKETVEAQNTQRSELEQKRSEFKAKMDELNDKTKAICAKADFAAIAAKTPCNAADITFEQMADSSKLNATQKKNFLKFRTEVAEVNKEMREYVRNNIVADSDRQWADYLDSTSSSIDGYNLDLYGGKVTWGEYNKTRKDLVAKNQAEHRRIFQLAH